MTKREKEIRTIAKGIKQVSKTQALKLARVYVQAREAAEKIYEIEFTDGTKWRKRK